MVGTCTNGDAAQISRGDEAGQIANHSAAERDDERFPFQPMRGELVVTALNRFEALGGFARWNGDGHGPKPRLHHRSFGGFAVMARNVLIRNDCTSTDELDARAFIAEEGQKARGNLYVIAAVAQGNVNGAHTSRIEARVPMSKPCRKTGRNENWPETEKHLRE